MNAYEAYDARPIGGGSSRKGEVFFSNYEDWPITGGQKILTTHIASKPEKKPNVQTTYQKKKYKIQIEEEDIT